MTSRSSNRNDSTSATLSRVRRTSALASSGRAAPFPYPTGRYSARTEEPSGASHTNAFFVTADGTPRHTTASRKPACAKICGIWAMCPNMSGRYPTSMTPPKAAPRTSPICRLRTMVSPEDRNSSMRMYHGPTLRRPAAASARSRPSASGRTSR